MSKKLKIDFISLIISLFIMGAAYLSDNTILWIISFIIGGRAKAIEGVKNTLENRALNVEFLMILSALGAFFIGYFQEGAILIFIFSLSGVLEEFALNKAEKTLTSLLNLVPETAIKYTDDTEVVVPIYELEKNDVVIVKVGQQVPADGIVIFGSTLLNEASITGESRLVEKQVGDAVVSGVLNESATIHVQLTLPAKDSAMQKIVDFIKEAQNENTETELGIKKFEKYYVYIVLLLSALVMIVPYLLNIWDLNTSIYRGIVLLVVGSPCALVASVSPVMLSAMSNATKKGVLIKGSKAIEQIANIESFYMDKTGTLTYGTPQVVDIAFEDVSETHLLDIIYHMEKQSNHPLGKAIVKYIDNIRTVETMNITTKEIKGIGLEAIIDDNHYFLGRKKNNHPKVLIAQSKGYTTVEFYKNDTLLALISLDDQLRSDAPSSISNLKNLGIKTHMITGDNAQSAQKIAKQLKIDSIDSGCLPIDKVNILKEAKKSETIAMLGDGINDGPALSIADVGIAMGSGTDVAMETADVILMNNSLSSVSKVINLSKKAKKVYTQNMFFSIIVIVFLVLMNFFQNITLPLGVVFHEGSTILVILNGLRLLRD